MIALASIIIAAPILYGAHSVLSVAILHWSLEGCQGLSGASPMRLFGRALSCYPSRANGL
jgi:hypothetical protein